jgi:hypothetical protein
VIEIYKNIILPVDLYGNSETWSLTLMEEHILSVFENRLLRRILGSQKEDVVGSCANCKLFNDKLHNLHTSPSRGEMRSAYRMLDGRPKGKRQTCRLRRR